MFSMEKVDQSDVGNFKFWHSLKAKGSERLKRFLQLACFKEILKRREKFGKSQEIRKKKKISGKEEQFRKEEKKS